MAEPMRTGSSRWRGPGTAFVLSLAAHAGVLGLAAWLLGAADGAHRGERLIAVDLAPAASPVHATAISEQAPLVAMDAPVEPSSAPAEAAAAAREPGGGAPTTAVLAAQAESEDDVERRRREALAARGAAGIDVPAHSQRATSSAAEPVAATPPPGADAAAQRGFVELHVLDWLARHRAYPRAAARARIEGTVHVRFVIDPVGRIADASVERSSGARVLDRAALDLLGRASPVPGLAQFGLAQALELRLPIDYRLRRAEPAG